jgi:AbrB family looped-hinge helix DNA binding protein
MGMRITTKGQVTIPAWVRERAGLLPQTEVDFVVEGETVRLVRSDHPKGETRGEAIVARLRGSATKRLNMSTDEIMKLLRGAD